MLAGTALITRAVYYSGQGVSYYGIWYVWVALFAFSFFRRSQAALHVAVVGFAYAVVLAVRHEPTAQGRWVTTIASLLIAGVFIDALVRRVRRQRRRAADDAENLAAVVNAMHRIFQQPTADATRADLCSTASRWRGRTAPPCGSRAQTALPSCPPRWRAKRSSPRSSCSPPREPAPRGPT